MARTIDPEPSEILVAFSGGKDSLATLDICSRRFTKIQAFFMYWVKGLDFQEGMLRWIERRYDITVRRVPHFDLPAIIGNQTLNWYRPGQAEFRQIRPREMEDHVRRQMAATWIASGEKVSDSMERRGMLMTHGPWDERRMHFYPIMRWSPTQVDRYLTLRHILLPPEYAIGMRRSWGGFRGEDMYLIRRHFPRDFEKIVKIFPFVQAVVRRYELYDNGGRDAGNRRKAKVQDGAGQSETVKPGSV